MNPQGPEHSDPIDLLSEWSWEQVERKFRVRVEKPIRIPDHASSPEPDIAWVTRKRYFRQHPGPEDIQLLIEVSQSSSQFDRTEKMQLYAQARIPEYWQVDLPSRTITVHRDPNSGRFGSIETFAESQPIHPLCLPQAKLIIAELLPG